jgi:high affinity Mn2+ porin
MNLDEVVSEIIERRRYAVHRLVSQRPNGRKNFLAAVICGKLLAILVFWIAAAMIAPSADGQNPGSTASESADPPAADEAVQTIFHHFKEGRFWISGQANFIFQTNPPFYAKYSGTNSFQPSYEKATSRVLTLYTGLELTKSIEVLADVEESGGKGLSQALGLAGFTNLDVVRNPTIGQAPYLARLMYHQVFALSNEKVENARSPLSTFAELPARRLEFRIGKFGMADFFDVNSVGGDSHLQFMNWTIDQNGGYDYAADTRGYTWGAIVEYQSPKWGLRFAEALLPTVANGPDFVWNLRRANASNVEFELHRGFLPKKDGIVRLLTYVNNANMGIYQVAIDQYLEGKVPTPEITNHPLQMTTKYGFGINFEQTVTNNIVVYGRFGWNNGKTESWAYTEVDQTFQGGAGFAGRIWKRRYDRAGIAFVSNGISKEHAQYLADGGLGFILGDGGLSYGRENILESYYTAHAWRGIYLGPDLQYIVNPGYNQVRGPIVVPGFRLHVEF